MGRRRASGEERVFVLVGDLKCDDRIEEVELRQVLTWRSEEHLRQQLLSGMPLNSKEVTLADTPAALSAGMYLPVDSDRSWLARVGRDRPTGPFRAQERLTFLVSEFVGSGGALVWRLEPRAQQRWLVQETKLGLALESLD